MPARKARKKGLLELAGRGDDGTTGLLGGGRVSKSDLLIEACGAVDEASSAIGLAKSLTSDARVREVSEELQRALYRLGAVLAASGEATFASIDESDLDRLEQLMGEMEAAAPMPSEFILPGTTPASAALDLARAVVRRAERRVVALAEAGRLRQPVALGYLNRLSLLLFVMGRFEEHRSSHPAEAARG